MVWDIFGRGISLKDAFSMVAKVSPNNLFTEWSSASSLPITEFIQLIEALPDK